MKILAVAGASGGHIFPALSFLDLPEDYIHKHNILLVLPSRSLGMDFRLKAGDIKFVESVKVSLRGFKPAQAVCLIRSFLQSLKIFSDFRPDIVVGFGSADSVFLIMLGWLLRARTVIHEQNVLPGRANLFLSRFVDRIAISFPETERYFPVSEVKIVLTGNPIRKSLIRMDKKKARKFFGLDEGVFTILVMEGSQGSCHINRSFLNSLKFMRGNNFQVIHIAGKGFADSIGSAYVDIGVKGKVFGFLREMEFAFSAADLVLARSGATTVTELIHFKLPSILSPYPFAREHQLENARVLSSKGCAIIIDDCELDSCVLSDTLKSFMDNPGKIEALRMGFKDFPEVNAAEGLRKQVLSLY